MGKVMSSVFILVFYSTTMVKVMSSDIYSSVAEPEPEPPGAATFRVEPEPIFFLGGARSSLFKAAPAASLRQAKKQGCGSGSAWIQEGKFVN